jgi:hypothetical protein
MPNPLPEMNEYEKNLMEQSAYCFREARKLEAEMNALAEEHQAKITEALAAIAADYPPRIKALWDRIQQLTMEGGALHVKATGEYKDRLGSVCTTTAQFSKPRRTRKGG